MRIKLKGFTLVELVVVMAIMSILMLGIMQMFKPIRTIYVDSTQYEAQRTAQNGVIQYITESVRFSTDMGIYNDGVTSASAAVDEFILKYCAANGVSGTDVESAIKKNAEIIIIDNSTEHQYASKKYTGRLIRRKGVGTATTVAADPALTAAATADWRIALGEAYYGSNTFNINLAVKDDDSDGSVDDGMLTVSVQSTKNGKRDISNAANETTLTDNITKSGVLCRNLVGGSNGVVKPGIFDVEKYNGGSATSGTKTYIVFLNNDGKEAVLAVS